MNRLSIRVGGVLVPVFALLAGCAAGAGGSGSGSTEEAQGSSSDHGKTNPTNGADASAPCDDAGTTVTPPPPAHPKPCPPPPCGDDDDDDASAPTPPDSGAPTSDDAGSPPAVDSGSPPPAVDSGSPVVDSGSPVTTTDGGSCEVDAYDGRATGIDIGVGVTLLNLNADLMLSDTGALPAIGGDLSAHVLNLTEANLATAGVLDSNTTGAGGSTTSTASVAGAGLTVAGLSLGLSADALTAHAFATCNGSGASISGGSDIANLAINGKAINVTGEPNQTINLGLARIVINEVTNVTSTQGRGEVKVAAIHVSAPNIADVIIAGATAGVTCSCDTAPPTPPTNPPPQCTTSADCQKGALCFNGRCEITD